MHTLRNRHYLKHYIIRIQTPKSNHLTGPLSYIYLPGCGINFRYGTSHGTSEDEMGRGTSRVTGRPGDVLSPGPGRADGKIACRLQRCSISYRTDGWQTVAEGPSGRVHEGLGNPCPP